MSTITAEQTTAVNRKHNRGGAPMPEIVEDRMMLGEWLGHRLRFTEQERAVLVRAARIARTARALVAGADEDADTLLAEIDHNICDLTEDARGVMLP